MKIIGLSVTLVGLLVGLYIVALGVFPGKLPPYPDHSMNAYECGFITGVGLVTVLWSIWGIWFVCTKFASKTSKGGD